MNTLKDLDPIKVPIMLGGSEVYLRYNLTARRYLEEFTDYKNLMSKDTEDWGAEDVTHLLRAGLIDFYFDENETVINKREFERVKPSLAAIGRLVDETGMVEITLAIISAIIASLPDAPTAPIGENFQTGGKN